MPLLFCVAVTGKSSRKFSTRIQTKNGTVLCAVFLLVFCFPYGLFFALPTDPEAVR